MYEFKAKLRKNRFHLNKLIKFLVIILHNLLDGNEHPNRYLPPIDLNVQRFNYS